MVKSRDSEGRESEVEVEAEVERVPVLLHCNAPMQYIHMRMKVKDGGSGGGREREREIEREGCGADEQDLKQDLSHLSLLELCVTTPSATAIFPVTRPISAQIPNQSIFLHLTIAIWCFPFFVVCYIY